MAGDRWETGPAGEQLKQILRATRQHGCRLEIVLKDLHTLRREPRRLAEWERTATDLVNETDN